MIRRPPRSPLFPTTTLSRSVLGGPSGAGKSTFMRSLTGNYLASAGTIRIRHDGEPVDITTATPRKILEIRRDRKSTRLNSSHLVISYAVFCLKKNPHVRRAG